MAEEETTKEAGDVLRRLDKLEDDLKAVARLAGIGLFGAFLMWLGSGNG